MQRKDGLIASKQVMSDLVPAVEADSAREPLDRGAGDPVRVLEAVYPPLLAAARVLSRDDAEDVVQEALIRVLARYPGFEGLSHPLAYTKAVLVRLVHRRRSAERLRCDRVDQFAVVFETSPSIEADAISGDTVRLLLADLPPRQRACVYLTCIEQLSDRQAAAILDCRPATIRTQTMRGLATLRARGADLFEEPR